MPRQHKCRSINAASGTTEGDTFESRGHNSVGLFVIARNLDTANDTLEVVLDAVHTAEGINSERTGPVRRPGTVGGSDRVGIDQTEMSDPDGNGTFAGFTFAHGVPAEHFAARISSFTDASGDGDLEVDAWLYFGNWNGPGREFREVV